MDAGKDGRTKERARSHPEERQRTDHAERPWPSVRPVEVRSGCRPHRHEDTAADRLDQAGADELIEVLRHPGKQRAEREDDERDHRKPARTPQVGEAAGQRHHQDVDQQVPIDDPAGLAELGPRRCAVGLNEVGQDRRERDGRDHQLEAGKEHARTEDGEQHKAGPAIHRRRV